MKRQNRRWGVQVLVLAGVTCLILIMTFLLTFRLDTLFDGVSSSESAAVATSAGSAQSLLENPISLPHKFVLYVLGQSDLQSIAAIRMVSISFGLLSVALFYIFVRSRFSARITILGSLAFCSNSVFLAISRNGSYLSSTLFATCALLAASQLFSKPRGFAGKGWLIGVLIALALFSPGVALLGVLLAIWYARQTIQATRVWPMTSLIPTFALPAISLALLSYGFYRDNSQILPWLGLPSNLPPVGTFVQNILEVAQMFFFQTKPHPEFFLSQTPILDIFTTVCFIIGLAYVQVRSTTQGFMLLTGLVTTGVCFIAVHDPIQSVAILLPLIFLGVAAGITMLLRQWLEIFPRNPFARTVGVAVMTIVVGISCLYQMNRYFVAFSQAPENRRVYSAPLIIGEAAVPATPNVQPGTE